MKPKPEISKTSYENLLILSFYFIRDLFVFQKRDRERERDTENEKKKRNMKNK